MAVQTQTPFKEYVANGVTTVFPLEFDCDNSDYLIVSLDGEEAPVGSWSLANDTVTFNTPPVNGVAVTLERNTPYQRTTDYQSYNNSFRPVPVNKDFDLIWWKLQELGYRDQVIWLALVKEISDRIDGDDNLQNKINTIDDWLTDLQQNVNENTSDIAQLVNDLSKEIADRIANDEALKEMFLAMMDEAINEGTINALAITHVASLEALEAIANVWDGRTVYVKDLGHYEYDSDTTSWVKAYQDADNVKDGIETQKQINDAQRLLNSKIIQIIESIDALRQFKPKQDGQAVYLKSHAIGKNKGGGIFLYSATSTALDNNGTIISCVDGGAFLRQYDSKKGYFEWFGAQCDGVTDDTNAVIAALKVLKTIHFSNKIKLTQPIDIDPFKVGQTLGITITGDGTESSYLEYYGCNFGFYSATDTFFRDLTFKAFQIKNADNNQIGIGVYIGSGGAEQINIASVTYRGWKIGRATHTWNSGFEKEVFRLCSYPYAMYGTSSNVSAPYAVSCPGPFLIGYAVSSTGTISIPTIPYAYSTISSHAADDCGQDGSIFKFGRCAGIDALTMGGERAKGQYIYDFSELVPSSAGQVVVEGYDVYINSAFTTIVGVAKSPNVAFGTLVFNNTKISTDKEIWLLSGDGSGVAVNNVQMNNRAFSRLTELPANGLLLDGVAIGSDYRKSGEIGLSLSANGTTFPRVKNRKGKALIDPTTQKLVFYAGALTEGLAQGLMMRAIIDVTPLTKGGTGTVEKHGIIKFGCAMDFNSAGMDMTRHLNVILLGTLTTATTVARNTANTIQLQFDVNFEVSSTATRYWLDIDIDYNGISNPNGLSWQVVAK